MTERGQYTDIITPAPWDILGVDPNAADDEVRRAYILLAKRLHPDCHTDSLISPNVRLRMEERFKEINQAYKQMRSRAAEENDKTVCEALDDANTLLHSKGPKCASEALEACRGIVSETPDDTRARWHYLYALCCWQMGQCRAACAQLRLAVSLSPLDRGYISMLKRMESVCGYRR